MKKAQKPTKDSNINRFLMGMTKIKDEHLYILRVHLLVEEQLRELINLKIRKPDALIEARLTFNQALCITKALYWKKGSEWLWDGIMMLNNARNSLSHKLTPEKYDKIIHDFLKLIESISQDEFAKSLSGTGRLLWALMFIYHNLSVLQFNK